MATELNAIVMTYREAVQTALFEEMERDERVVLLGEDIGASGGPFKSTVGLYERFGGDRVMDMPIAENGFVGAALGMAVTGLRPVVEIMFSDFLGVCMDQLVNSVAKYRYMCGGQTAVPLVVRSIGGGGLRFGAQHSQSGESWLRVFPGLKIVAAATPQDAYSLLKSAIRDDNPVIVIEHKALYGAKAGVARGDETVPLDRARVVRHGSDLTLVASLQMVGRSVEAARALHDQHEIDAEVIDVRSLLPLDVGRVAESVQKTNRLITVEEQPVEGGWGGDLVASVVEQAFDYFDAPPARIGIPGIPLPYSPVLEDAAIPSVESIVETALRVVKG